MCCNKSMNSLACKGRARKASKLRKKQNQKQKQKKHQIFGPKKFVLPLYFGNAAPPRPIKRGSIASHTKCARKGKRKGRKERKKGEKMGD